MTPQYALGIVSAYEPCSHDEWEDLGYGQLRRCENCSREFRTDMEEEYRINAKKFTEAIDVLYRLVELAPAPAGNDSPEVGV